MLIHEFPHPSVIIHYHPTNRQFTLDDVSFALDQRLHALELDLRFRRRDNQVVCNHDRATAASPSLEQAIDLILSKKRDSPTVYRDGCQFFLVLDLKDDTDELFQGILSVLQRHAAHLSTAVGETDSPRGITVVISGEYRHRFYASFPPEQINRFCIVEDHNYDAEIVSLARHDYPFQWVALESGREQRRVNGLHVGTDSEFEGRYNVRVWNCGPDDFGLCLAAGVDQINCNREHLEPLKRIIRDHSPRGNFPALAVWGSQVLLTWRGRSSNDLYAALGAVTASGLSFARQIALTHLLADELLILSPAGGLAPDGRLVIVYEGLSDEAGLLRLWYKAVQRLPRRLACCIRKPQSLRYIAGRFGNIQRFVTFDGQERYLILPSQVKLRGREPTVAIGPDGRILIVYEGVADRGLRYVSATLSPKGELMGQDHPLIEGETCLGRAPAVAIDQAGRVIVVFEHSEDQELVYVTGFVNSSGMIQGRRCVLTQGDVGRGIAPAIALDGTGRVMVAYQKPPELELHYFSGNLDGSGRIIGLEFALCDGKTRRGRDPCVAFDDVGWGIMLYEKPDDNAFWYVHGPLWSGRLIGEARMLKVGLERC